MFEHYVSRISLSEAYHAALWQLHEYNEELPCFDYNTNQKECSMTFVVEDALAEPMISKLFIGDPQSLEQYVQEICDGILDFEVAAGRWEYTYHDRIAAQIPWVIEELRRNPDTRRAVLHVRRDEDMDLDSPACLQHIQYMIRGGKLHCKVLLRSNDAVKATFMNAFAFIMLQKKIADAIRVPIGSYAHRANSFHVYERDYSVLDAYVSQIRNNTHDPEALGYHYKNDWEFMMGDEQSIIRAKVAQMKERVGEKSDSFST